MSDIPAGWYPDPSGRFEVRYWNGQSWTEHTARPRAVATAHTDHATNDAADSTPTEVAARSDTTTRTPRRRRPQVISGATAAERRNAARERAATTSAHASAERDTPTRQQSAEPASLRERIGSLGRSGLRDAVVLNEVLGAPVALRPPER